MLARLSALVLAIVVTPACVNQPTAAPEEPQPAASKALETADPEPVDVAATEPARSRDEGGEELPPPWWTPVAPISLEELSQADQAAVKDCVEQHRVTESDATADELYAGAVCLGAHRAYGSEIKVFTRLLQQYPDAPQYGDVLVALGQRYEQIDMRAKAVDAYRTLLAKYAKRDDAQPMGKRAVCLARSLGDAATVETLLADLHRRYGRQGFVVPPDVAFEQLCIGLPPMRR